MTKSPLQITFIGHATTLIQAGGQSFLTDPNFSDKVLFFKRIQKPGLDAKNLPELSAILVSHAHYDHLDLFSYKFFKTTTPIVVPKGIGKFMRKFLPNPVTEIPPEGLHQQQDVRIHALPVNHHGFRWIPLRHRAATAYVLESGMGNIYFAGDSAYGDHFKATGQRFEIDVALLPLTHCPAGHWARNKKSNVDGALQAMLDLKAKHMIPIRWGTFCFGREDPQAASHLLRERIAQKGLEARVHILAPGETFSFDPNAIIRPLAAVGSP